VALVAAAAKWPGATSNTSGANLAERSSASLNKRVAVVVTNHGNSGENIANGDVVEAVMSGNSLIIKINGVQVNSAIDSTFSTKTLHGFYASMRSGTTSASSPLSPSRAVEGVGAAAVLVIALTSYVAVGRMPGGRHRTELEPNGQA
jgi:hypothetical protein